VTIKTKRKLWQLQIILIQQGRKKFKTMPLSLQYSIETDSECCYYCTVCNQREREKKTEQSDCLGMGSEHCTYYMFIKIQMARQIIVSFMECRGTLQCNGWSDDVVKFSD
jgi:hypothetical protein